MNSALLVYRAVLRCSYSQLPLPHLNATEHARLPKFEKNFYIEHPNVTNRSSAEGDAWRRSVGVRLFPLVKKSAGFSNWASPLPPLVATVAPHTLP